MRGPFLDVAGPESRGVRRPHCTSMLFAPVLGGASVVLSLACTSVAVHGLVLDQHGKSVPDAVVTVTASDTGVAVANASSDAHGCIDLFETVKHERSVFALEVGARGYKPARFTFARRSRGPLLITLAADSDPAASTVRPLEREERSTTYDPVCAPVVPPAATSMGIR